MLAITARQAATFFTENAMEKACHKKEDLNGIFKGYLHDLNHHLPKYIRIADFEIVPAEFEKTPKKSIKRFLYQ